MACDASSSSSGKSSTETFAIPSAIACGEKPDTTDGNPQSGRVLAGMVSSGEELAFVGCVNFLTTPTASST
jgi:hypothetical protein